MYRYRTFSPMSDSLKTRESKQMPNFHKPDAFACASFDKLRTQLDPRFRVASSFQNSNVDVLPGSPVSSINGNQSPPTNLTPLLHICSCNFLYFASLSITIPSSPRHLSVLPEISFLEPHTVQDFAKVRLLKTVAFTPDSQKQRPQERNR
jgi:hypothetical protein